MIERVRRQQPFNGASSSLDWHRKQQHAVRLAANEASVERMEMLKKRYKAKSIKCSVQGLSEETSLRA